MRFESEEGPPIEDPSEDEIASALRDLRDGFAILSREENEYLQVTGGSDGGYLLERQEGAVDRHFQTRDKSIPLDLVIDAFERFARGDSSWADEFDWERLQW